MVALRAIPRPKPRRAGWLSAGALALALTVGCVSEKQTGKITPGPDSGSGPIQEINLLAIPVALNLDQKPGPDGFVIKIFASNRQRPKPMPISDGRIEIQMYDGIPGLTEGASNQPKRTWTYTAQELKLFEIHASIGTGYQVASAWGDAKPTYAKIAVVVSYTPPGGKTIVSAPSIIAVTTK